MYASFWDAVAFVIAASILGSFSFWLIGYFAIEAIRYVVRGPSEQLQSVGTSVLNERPVQLAVSPTPVQGPSNPPSRAA